MRRRVALYAKAVAAGFLVLGLAWYFCFALPAGRKAGAQKDGYKRIGRGMTEAEVLAIMGEPYSIRENGEWAVKLWDWEKLDDETARGIGRTYRYDVTMWPSIPRSLIGVSFDKEGRVVGKHEYY